MNQSIKKIIEAKIIFEIRTSLYNNIDITVKRGRGPSENWSAVDTKINQAGCLQPFAQRYSYLSPKTTL